MDVTHILQGYFTGAVQLEQSSDCTDASEAAQNNMGK